MAAQLAGRTFDMTTVHRFTDPEYADLTVRMRNGEHPASLFDRLHTLGSRPAPTMKLEFLFIPTADLGASLALYRDGHGFTELWREGDTTVALALPGSEVQIMLDANDPTAPVSPIFVVESVAAFHSARPNALAVVEGPAEIPGGVQVTYREPGGATIQVIDQSTEAEV